MTITDDYIVDSLTRNGISLNQWVAIDSLLVGYVNDRGELMARIIEDDALAVATLAFLRRRGQVHYCATTGLNVRF